MRRRAASALALRQSSRGLAKETQERQSSVESSRGSESRNPEERREATSLTSVKKQLPPALTTAPLRNKVRKGRPVMHKEEGPYEITRLRLATFRLCAITGFY